MREILATLHQLLTDYGYLAIAITLLGENAGLPLPGETILLVASFAAYQGTLDLRWLILTGIVAATIGDNLGFGLGVWGGRPLLEKASRWFHMRHTSIERGERLFAKYGSFTVFFARFIAGMRIVTGPLAGVLRMPWRSFAVWNFLGACVWVTTICLLGYEFGHQHHRLVRWLKLGELAILLVIVVLLIVWWRRSQSDS